VDPEVSTLNFNNGVVLVQGGSKVPALDARKAHVVVELQQGQTLAIAGLHQLIVQGSTNRFPGLGDLPFVGQFFSNTQSTRQERELLVLVTPYLVEPQKAGRVPPSPGDEVNEPNDLELYFLNRIEGRTGRDARATTLYDDPLHALRLFMKLENTHVRGIHGYED
jgi:pilus assembly protein CpaC